ncbi:MAG: YbaB/EbfC family nucleoid-associated protein [Actinomycetota bacterium]|nr:YbaB/EbfC family nucleoid-associated protein [Actinomycetota bacterium]
MDINKLMKQAKKMQDDMARVQKELEEETVEATAGGGMVKVVASGSQKILEVSIDREAVDPADVEMLQDLVLAAVNEAVEASKDLAAKRLAAVTGGAGMPSLM